MYSVFNDAKRFVPAVTIKERNKNGQSTKHKEVHTARLSFGFVFTVASSQHTLSFKTRLENRNSSPVLEMVVTCEG